MPAGGIGLGPEEYADFVGKEYLGDYVRSGGAAVRFVVAGSDAVGARWHHSLAGAADAEGYLYVAVDAEEHRVHLVDQVFAAVARQVDWMELARRQVRAGWESLGLPPAAPDELAVAYVAAHHDVDVPEAARSIRRYLETTLLRDPTLDREFRMAVLRLCQAELATGEVLDAERDAVLAWLRVEPVALRLLRSASLHGRVARHNARSLLVSLAAWRARRDRQRARAGPRPEPARCRPDGPPLEQRSGHYYSQGRGARRLRGAAPARRRHRRAAERVRRGHRAAASWSPTRRGGCPPTAPCSCGSSTRSATGAAPTRSPRSSGSRPGWRPCHDRP